MQIIRFIFLFTCISQLYYSQSGGYMGKHLHVGYGFNTSPALINTNANLKTVFGDGASAESGTLAFNVVHEVYLDYILSSKWTIGFSGRFYKTTFDNSMGYKNPFDQLYSYSYSSREEGSERPNGYYNITGQSYALCFKFFGSRYVAPWGRYVMFGPVLNTYKAVYDPKIMNDELTVYNNNYYYNYYYQDTLLSDFGPTTQSFKKIGLMVGWGRSRIIANRITIDYGVTAQPLSIVSVALRQSGFASIFFKKDISNTNYIAESSKRRVQGINTINVFLKVGFLF
jgi:hypothetical protein